ncbi:MAG TPA: ATP-binding cassette domain-containing protein [Solirubrobacterales bacterium]|jgi:UDP-glucose/iron transport system ATP-binding protein|nr:ATP-binding cassette domain-containing protein [Solirubrobacterales bacterium]
MLFELERVSLRRGGEPVLVELSARFPEGVSAVVGPSGSGKSTLLRLLDRLSDPDKGVVRFRGTDTRELDPLQLRREVALVPQLPALLDGTVADNIGFAAGLSERDSDLDRLLGLAGLDGSFADRDVERLSVGEQQRTMIARALATEPDVLLLDEPTSALDEHARDSVERTVVDLHRQLGNSIVIVTHDPEQARRLAEWVVRIDAGRLVEQGAAAGMLA